MDKNILIIGAIAVVVLLFFTGEKFSGIVSTVDRSCQWIRDNYPIDGECWTYGTGYRLISSMEDTSFGCEITYTNVNECSPTPPESITTVCISDEDFPKIVTNWLSRNYCGG